jgi:hypothetical protein
LHPPEGDISVIKDVIIKLEPHGVT